MTISWVNVGLRFCGEKEQKTYMQFTNKHYFSARRRT
jgi:hypothetical protein